MKDLQKLVLTLALVAALSGAILALTERVTREPIRKAAENRLFASLRRVLPPAGEDPVTLVFTNAAGSEARFFALPQNGAVAFTARSENGYGGALELLVGLDAEGRIHGLDVLQHNETPGLGTQVKNPAFADQFPGKPLDGTAWSVSSEGGAVDAVSGATISSRAYCEALRHALALYQEHRPAIRAALANP